MWTVGFSVLIKMEELTYTHIYGETKVHIHNNSGIISDS